MSGALQKLTPLVSRITRQSSKAPGLKRGYADHGEVKVNFWEKPMAMSEWKEEHVVFVMLGGWAVGIFSAMKIFGGKKEEAAPPA